jgi:hypothetical protein
MSSKIPKTVLDEKPERLCDLNRLGWLKSLLPQLNQECQVTCSIFL